MSEFNFKKYVENNPLLKENQDLKETLDDEVLAMAEKMVEMMGAEAVVNAIVRAMSTDDAKLYLGGIMRDYGMLNEEKKEVNEVELLSNNVAKLDTRLEQVFNNLGNDLDPKMIDALTKLAREIRESLKYLMEFKGKLVHKRQDTIIVAQMQIVQEVLAQNNPEIWLDIKKRMQEKLQ